MQVYLSEGKKWGNAYIFSFFVCLEDIKLQRCSVNLLLMCTQITVNQNQTRGGVKFWFQRLL